MAFREVADRVFVLRYPVLDVNSTLIVGDGAALLVDTLSTPAQAAALRDAVRAVTAAPLTLVNTHHHFDHCFGNATFGDVEVWGHERAAATLRAASATRIRKVYEEYGDVPGLEDLLDVTIVPPTRLVRAAETLDVGGRAVTLRYLGRGHTDDDLVVTVDDVLLTGDLIEEGAAPSFGDSFPLEWPATVAALLPLATGPVIPGHGAVVGLAEVRAQHAELAALEWAIREGHADGAPAQAVADRASLRWKELTPEAALAAVRRGYADL